MIWQLPIPLYDAREQLHEAIVDAAKRAEQIAASVELPNQNFQALRRLVRDALAEAGLTEELDALAAELLAKSES